MTLWGIRFKPRQLCTFLENIYLDLFADVNQHLTPSEFNHFGERSKLPTVKGDYPKALIAAAQLSDFIMRPVLGLKIQDSHIFPKQLEELPSIYKPLQQLVQHN